MIPTDVFISIVPEDLVPIAGAIAGALSGNPADVGTYTISLSATGSAPATHYATTASCTREFLDNALFFLSHPVNLATAVDIPDSLAADYCNRAKLYPNAQLEDVLSHVGLKVIENYSGGRE